MTRRRRITLSLLCWLIGCLCIPIFVAWRGDRFYLEPWWFLLFELPRTLVATLAGYLLALPILVLSEKTVERSSVLNLLTGLALGPITLLIDCTVVAIFTREITKDALPDRWYWEVIALSTAAVTALYLYLITPPSQRRKH